MVDSYTGKPLKIFAGSDGWATILVRVAQLADVRRVLDAHEFRYEVSPRHISINNEPYTTLIDVRPPADPHLLQRLLDDAEGSDAAGPLPQTGDSPEQVRRGETTTGEVSMLDSFTQQPIKVFAGADGYSSILVRVDQLADIRRILDTHAIPYQVSPHHISVNNEPFTTMIDLRQHTDPDLVQQLLDAASQPETRQEALDGPCPKSC